MAVSCRRSRQWMMMTTMRRQVLTHVIITRRHVPVLVQGHASRHCVALRRRWSAVHQTSSGTAMNSVSPTTNLLPTLTTSKNRRRELGTQTWYKNQASLWAAAEAVWHPNQIRKEWHIELSWWRRLMLLQFHAADSASRVYNALAQSICCCE